MTGVTEAAQKAVEQSVGIRRLRTSVPGWTGSCRRLLAQVTRRVLEAALEAEMSDHLGYDRGDPAGRGAGNSRDGSSGKAVLTDVGPVTVRVPRDRKGEFTPQIVPCACR
jgi:transposase-like protein